MSDDLLKLGERRRRIERVFSAADRMARRMGGKFVIEPRKLRQYVRYLRARSAA